MPERKTDALGEKMPRLESVTIRRFKRLQEVIIPLTESTIIVGANNAGKSSVLQAIHFAVAVAQSSKLAGGVSWAADKYELSISPIQLLYSPVADVLSLASGGTLVEDRAQRIQIQFNEAGGISSTVSIRRGRNRNIAIEILGRDLGERLQNLANPFSVYAPGLAGVPREESYLPLSIIRRVVARGDANLALRNVLFQLSRDTDKWEQFLGDMRTLFPHIAMSVDFNDQTDEHIRATFATSGGPRLPLDAAGTSILQASQILSYVALFQPRILILDEPDSHLHPDNQRALCDLVFRIAQDRNFQAIISTHSRHVLDASRGRGNLVWLSRGSVQEQTNIETTSVLLDIGALDSADYFVGGQIRCVVATEDQNRDAIRTVLWSSGFKEDETEVVSYSGCSKVEAAIVLGGFLREKAQGITLMVHRDRDYIAVFPIRQVTLAPGNRLGRRLNWSCCEPHGGPEALLSSF